MKELELELKAMLRSRLDPLTAGALPASVRSRARRGRSLMVALATLTSLSLIAAAVVAVSAWPQSQRERSVQPPPLTPYPIVERENGRIAYSASGGEAMELRTVRSDGTDQRVIPAPEGDPWGHSWSPDGSRLAVVIFAGGGDRSIWVMDPDGSKTTQVASSSLVSTPSWSPDGRTLAYSATNNGRTAIHLVEVDGSNDRIIHAEGTFAIFSVQFSPDGTKLLFDRGTDAGFDIFVMDLDGSDLKRLTSTGNDYDPAWSPDGTQIVFTREDDSKADANTVVTSDIFVMNTDGSAVQRLTETQPGSTDLNPVWAPDGSKIAYMAGRSGGPGRVIVMNPDGSDAVTLVEEDVVGLSWQPRPTSRGSGVRRVTVPDVVGLTFRDACEAAEGRLMLRVENYGHMEDCDERSVVVTQRPAPGRKVSAGSGLIITLSPRKP